MIKKTLIITTLFLTLAAANTAFAASISPTPSTGASENSQINQLKNKIASQVAKLNLVEKRGIIGTIQSTTNNQITLTDNKGQTRYVDLDEITKFSSGSNSTFGLSDLKKGMVVSVLGIYNKDSQRILARFVDTITTPIRYSGEITSLDPKNFQFTVMTVDQKSAKVEVDTTSTVYSYSSGGDLTKYGFSKLSVGDRVYVIGYPDKTDSTLLITDTMIDYLDTPKIPNLTLVTPTVEPTLAPTSAGAKSIKPIK